MYEILCNSKSFLFFPIIKEDMIYDIIQSQVSSAFNCSYTQYIHVDVQGHTVHIHIHFQTTVLLWAR